MQDRTTQSINILILKLILILSWTRFTIQFLICVYFQIDRASLSINGDYNYCGGYGVKVTIYSFGGSTCTLSHGDFSTGDLIEWDKTTSNIEKLNCYIARGEKKIKFKFTTTQGTQEAFCPKKMYIKAGNENFYQNFDYYSHDSSMDNKTFFATKD